VTVDRTVDGRTGDSADGLQLIREGRPRRFDADYQRDLLEYRRMADGILQLVAVRAAPPVHALLLTVALRVPNRGRVEAFVSRGSIHVDIALLDQLWLFSFEQGVADSKHDPYHMLHFTLTYFDALHAGAGYRQLDPYNSAALTDDQFRRLWNDARDVQSIAFENTLSLPAVWPGSIRFHRVGI
jgi:hypothetical protein